MIALSTTDSICVYVFVWVSKCLVMPCNFSQLASIWRTLMFTKIHCFTAKLSSLLSHFPVEWVSSLSCFQLNITSEMCYLGWQIAYPCACTSLPSWWSTDPPHIAPISVISLNACEFGLIIHVIKTINTHEHVCPIQMKVIKLISTMVAKNGTRCHSTALYRADVDTFLSVTWKNCSFEWLFGILLHLSNLYQLYINLYHSNSIRFTIFSLFYFASKSIRPALISNDLKTSFSRILFSPTCGRSTRILLNIH